jgi:hypothetical protein
VLGKRQSILRVQPAAFLFAQRFGGCVVELRGPRLLASLVRSL